MVPTRSIAPGWSRREVMGAGVAGGVFATLGGLPAALRAAADGDDLAGKVLNLVLRYRTDPERIARMLPPGLEPDEVAEVTIDWWLRYPERGGENLFFPGPYAESGIHVTARYQGQRGMFQVGMPLDQDWGRVSGRENVGLLKKDGALTLRREGRRVYADLRRRGKLLYRMETTASDEPAHPVFWHRETGYGAFLYRYRLHPDWRRGPLGLDAPSAPTPGPPADDAEESPVELWLRVLGGKTGRYPDRMRVGGARVCDAADTRFELVDPSPLDPYVELPVRSIVGVSYFETGLVPQEERDAPGPRTESRIERLQFVDKREFEPWALYNYDRPVTAGRAWTPTGWPQTATAFKLSRDELERYRQRYSLDLEVRRWLDLELQLDRDVHRRTLPPVLQGAASPHLRIVALDVGTNDVSTLPFTELWLLVSCEHGGQSAWYALSHLVGTGGDVVSGRETFGYPSRMAAIEWRASGSRFSLRASRLGRDVVRLEGPSESGGATDTGSKRIDLIGLRQQPPYRVMTLHGFSEPGARGELVAQPWALEGGSRQTIDPGALVLELPDQAAPGRIGAPDPWYEFSAAPIVAAAAGAGAVLRRQPGREPVALPDHGPYYLERFDGAATAGEATSGKVRHTFLVG